MVTSELPKEVFDFNEKLRVQGCDFFLTILKSDMVEELVDFLTPYYTNDSKLYVFTITLGEETWQHERHDFFENGTHLYHIIRDMNGTVTTLTKLR